MQCLGTIEFLCDFHEQCHRTQQDFLTAKERAKTSVTRQSEVDIDSDKENVLPQKTNAKRKIRIVQNEPSKVTNDTTSKTVNRETSQSPDTKSACHVNISDADNAELKDDNDSLSKRENVCVETFKTTENGTESVESVEAPRKCEESLQEKDPKIHSLEIVPCTAKSDTMNDIIVHLEYSMKDNCEVVETELESSHRKRCTRSMSQISMHDAKRNKYNTNSRKKVKEVKNSIKKSLTRNGKRSKYKQKSKRSKDLIEKRTILRSMIRNDDHIFCTTVNSNLSGTNNNIQTRNDTYLQETRGTTSTPSFENDANFENDTTSNIPEMHDQVTSDAMEKNEINDCAEENSQDIVKNNAVPVIVKQEKFEADEIMLRNSQLSKPNQFVWLPNATMLREPEKPKPKKGEKLTNKSPAPGDEAENNRTQSMNLTESGPVCDKHTSTHNSRILSTRAADKPQVFTKQNRKSVIESTQNVRANRILKIIPKDNGSTMVSCSVKNASSCDSTNNVSDESNFRIRRESANGKFGKVSELISNEQKEAIETLYHIDPTVVNNDEVYNNLTFIDKINIQCNICGSVYPRMDKCQVHIWGHLGMKPYCCNACDFSTVTVSNVRCHIRKSHLKIKPFECHLCEKKYVTAVLLEEHLNIHTGAKPYRCKLCDFSSASRQVLSYHKTTHKPVKDINCNICGKEFYSKGRMRAHMIIHNKNKAFMCKFCSTYLCNAEALEKHCENIHSRDYICNICGKCTKSKKALHNHQNVHSAAKHKCPICPNVYKSSHILKEHLLKHEGIRKYKCNICEKSFAQQSHLAAHNAVHSEKRYFCPGCNKPFNRHDNMKMHTKRCEMFLANPELSDLLAKRNKSRSTTEISNSEKSSKNPNTSWNTSKSEKENTLITLKTDVKYSKTDLYLSMPNSGTNDIGNNVIESKNAKSIKIGEVDVFPVVETNVTNTQMNVNVTVVENVLGPECF